MGPTTTSDQVTLYLPLFTRPDEQDNFAEIDFFQEALALYQEEHIKQWM